ncbi:MAG: hypothetical protein BGO25_03960 [Acidobacteriales bacterium 59-55]|nr:MAG: hypothetical protein BGO25_03960 [Acidobacteriales bacterium 59-55]
MIDAVEMKVRMHRIFYISFLTASTLRWTWRGLGYSYSAVTTIGTGALGITWLMGKTTSYKKAVQPTRFILIPILFFFLLHRFPAL